MRRGGILPRILQSWWAPRRVVRGLSDMPEAEANLWSYNRSAQFAGQSSTGMTD